MMMMMTTMAVKIITNMMMNFKSKGFWRNSVGHKTYTQIIWSGRWRSPLLLRL